MQSVELQGTGARGTQALSQTTYTGYGHTLQKSLLLGPLELLICYSFPHFGRIIVKIP